MRLGKILEYFESSAMFSAQDKQKYNHMFLMSHAMNLLD
jgi:hypothetical protein